MRIPTPHCSLSRQSRAARCLVEELNIDINIRGDEGLTAREKIETEGEFPLVAEYLKGVEGGGDASSQGLRDNADGPEELAPLPDGLSLTVGTPGEAGEVPAEPDPVFRQRIEQLAARADFHTPQGQADLRELVEDAIASQRQSSDRNVRPRQG